MWNVKAKMLTRRLFEYCNTPDQRAQPRPNRATLLYTQGVREQKRSQTTKTSPKTG